MKKNLFSIVTLVMIFVAADTALAAYYVNFDVIQHRKYENGNEFNRAAFSVRESDGGPYVMSDVININTITLYDPDGTEILPTKVIFDPSWRALYGNFSSTTGQWNFNAAFSSPEPAYYINFDEPLIQGTYHLYAEENDGTPHDVYKEFNALANLPTISSSTFRGYEDSAGDFILTWDLPVDLYFWTSGLSTSYRVIITVSMDGSYSGDLWVTQPTPLGLIIVPSTVMQTLKAEGNTLKAQIQIRTNDNNNRTYSNAVNLDAIKTFRRQKVVVIPLN